MLDGEMVVGGSGGGGGTITRAGRGYELHNATRENANETTNI